MQRWQLVLCYSDINSVKWSQLCSMIVITMATLTIIVTIAFMWLHFLQICQLLYSLSEMKNNNNKQKYRGTVSLLVFKVLVLRYIGSWKDDDFSGTRTGSWETFPIWREIYSKRGNISISSFTKKNIGDCEKAEGERERGMNNEWSTSTCQTIRFRSF